MMRREEQREDPRKGKKERKKDDNLMGGGGVRVRVGVDWKKRVDRRLRGGSVCVCCRPLFSFQRGTSCVLFQEHSLAASPHCMEK